jgi:hypothetical protein
VGLLIIVLLGSVLFCFIARKKGKRWLDLSLNLFI